jgi:hypothetical protein
MKIVCISGDLCRKIQQSVIICLTVFVVLSMPIQLSDSFIFEPDIVPRARLLHLAE